MWINWQCKDVDSKLSIYILMIRIITTDFNSMVLSFY